MCEDWPILQISYARAQRETQGAPQTIHFSFSGADLLRCHCSKNSAASELACVGYGSAELETNHLPISDVSVARKGIILSFLKLD